MVTCIKCGKSDMETRSASVPAEIKGEHFLVQMSKALVCPACCYATVDGRDMPEYMRLTADAYRRKHGLLTSDEIRALRGRLRMTQDEFASYLGGVGVASVKRWELGQIQAKAMDRLIRLMVDQWTARENSRTLSVITPELDNAFALENQNGPLKPARVAGFASGLRAVMISDRQQNTLGNGIVPMIEGFVALPKKPATAEREHGLLAAIWSAGQNQISGSL
ncbi:MAG TPA: type II TA system antitoxin MqsA family protein [Bryobacteraceae bacterium]|nr:type II TA system antitoxin MqsA family protein [Bryobacteraceae bacterium]